MRITKYLPSLCSIFLACGNDLSEYELDEGSFDSETMARIERESGIDIADGSRGLAYHYVPPIDPIVFAKIEIPTASAKQMETRIAAIKSIPNFPERFANERCAWWPTHFESAIVSRRGRQNGFYVEAYLAQENERVVMYIKYFTI